MHHPGPPRFTSVGRSVELAPRDPVPDAAGDPSPLPVDAASERFVWTLADAPADSEATLGDGPVVHLAPDEPGTYRCRLAAPDGDHTVVVRAFPDERRPARIAVPVADLPVPDHRLERVSLVGAFNDHRPGRDRPEREGNRLVVERRLAPGHHRYSLLANDDYESAFHGELVVPGPGRPRVHLTADADADTVVVTADAERPPTAVGDHDADDEHPLAVEFHLDDRDDLTRQDVTVEGRRLTVPRDALPDDGSVRVHAVAVAERHSVADTVVLRGGAKGGAGEARGGAVDEAGDGAVDEAGDGAVDEAGGRAGEASEPTDGAPAAGVDLVVERPNDPPAWGESPTIYEIFVRTFAGGTLDTTFAELERRVPYLDSLHVDAVWLTPVVASPTRHGYHVTDYFDTAADLGTRAEFESFVETCHDHGIRVLFDLVVNHTSRDHPAFQLHSAGVAGYEDLYARVAETPFGPDGASVPAAERDPDWAGPGAPDFYFNWTRIPNVNYDSLSVRAWMLSVVDEWAAVVDGFRCDVAWGVPHGFWKEVRDRVPDDFLLLDETIPADASYHEAEFDCHYDTRLYHALRDIGEGEEPATVLFDVLRRVDGAGFPRAATQMRYVENHDETRYLTECGRRALKAATAVTFCLPGAPMVYAGQERGVPGQRGRMRWHDGDDDLTAFHRGCARLRREYPELGTGGRTDVEPVALSPAPAHLVAFRRSVEDGGLVVVCNFGDEPETTTIDRDVGTTDLLTGEQVAVEDVVRVDGAVVLRAE
jgi:glycosidase